MYLKGLHTFQVTWLASKNSIKSSEIKVKRLENTSQATKDENTDPLANAQSSSLHTCNIEDSSAVFYKEYQRRWITLLIHF